MEKSRKLESGGNFGRFDFLGFAILGLLGNGEEACCQGLFAFGGQKCIFAAILLGFHHFCGRSCSISCPGVFAEFPNFNLDQS